MQLTECTRDAIQGIKAFIPTQKKVDYLNKVLATNCFDVLDFGSFVSPKAMPQMADTKDVVEQLNLANSKTKLLAIIANLRGAEEASKFEKISILGYPFSVSETFSIRNTNKNIEQSFDEIEAINNVCKENSKELLVYLSMGFGNPYGDEWSISLLIKITERLMTLGISNFALSDTVGIADAPQIEEVYKSLTKTVKNANFGAHLHTIYEEWEPKVKALEKAGCQRIDGSIKGFGGCPMAQNNLVGNMPSEQLLRYYNKADSSTIKFLDEAFQTLIN